MLLAAFHKPTLLTPGCWLGQAIYLLTLLLLVVTCAVDLSHALSTPFTGLSQLASEREAFHSSL